MTIAKALAAAINDRGMSRPGAGDDACGGKTDTCRVIEWTKDGFEVTAVTVTLYSPGVTPPASMVTFEKLLLTESIDRVLGLTYARGRMECPG